MARSKKSKSQDEARSQHESPPAATPDAHSEATPPERGVYTSRTLNLRSIRAIGYDMDYTLVHYNIEEWERRAFEYLRSKLVHAGWPVDETAFDPQLVIRGLIIDRELGNVVKANRFGYVMQSAHGTHMLGFEEQKQLYARTVIDLADDRWVFMNALFSLSEAVMYGQLVDLLDQRKLPEVLGYQELYERVRRALDQAHIEGQLKAEIAADPERFVEPDPDAALALLDQRAAGKKLLLITNSGWEYTRQMMSHAYDQYLPGDMTWRDLFDIVIVSARKPDFFDSNTPVFEMVSDDGLLRPCKGGIVRDGVFVAGNAAQVENYLGVDGTEVLYVGDHMYSDVHASKKVRRWRTALIVRELEGELAAQAAFRATQRKLDELMTRKETLEHEYAQARLDLLRRRKSYGPRPRESIGRIQSRIGSLRARLTQLDEEIAPLARAAGELHNPRWGMLMRAGKDKSHLAWQIERHADIYTSRVSNFLHVSPYAYLRSPRGSLPHDPCPGSWSVS
jgi:HAD superfamily 5'-nucleotidase-like hydrolase